jgi:hypothetical protein
MGGMERSSFLPPVVCLNRGVCHYKGNNLKSCCGINFPILTKKKK